MNLNDTPLAEYGGFPSWVDATALSAYKSCWRKGYYQNNLRLTSSVPNPHFRAGGAYAKAHEHARNLIYAERVPTDEAVARALVHLIRDYGDFEPTETDKGSVRAKTWLGVSDAFIRYYQRWSPEFDWVMPDMHLDGGTEARYLPSNEFSFAVPLPIDHPVTGDPLLYAGRADMRVRLGAAGCWQEFKKDPSVIHSWPLYIFDDKSTYQMGPTWAKQWTFRSQFLGYVWANNQIFPAPHDKARGAVVAGAGIQMKQTKTDRAVTPIAQWKIDTWYDSTMYFLEELIRRFHENKWPQNWDSTCTAYSGCEFQPLCDSPSPERWMSNYVLSDWNPVPSPKKED